MGLQEKVGAQALQRDRLHPAAPEHLQKSQGIAAGFIHLGAMRMNEVDDGETTQRADAAIELTELLAVPVHLAVLAPVQGIA
ncbi:hypothetical protein D3C78_1711270 [compost metagenome]